MVIGGDAVGWMRQGEEYFREARWQLDRFHLARPPVPVLPKEVAVRAGGPAGAIWRASWTWSGGPRTPGLNG